MLNEDNKTREHLANERTFLAWIRTSIALMGFGFVIVKFAVFVRQVGLMVKEPLPPLPRGYAAEIGVGMVVFGAVVAVIAYFHFRKNRQLINASTYSSASGYSLIVTILIIMVSVMLVWTLLPNMG